MKLEQKIINRLQELINFVSEIEATLFQSEATVTSELNWDAGMRINRETPAYNYVNPELANQWGVSCLQIIQKISGKESDYYIKFNELFPRFFSTTNYPAIKTASGIVKAIKSDYENGYLFDSRALIEAEVFDDFLEQYEHLLNQAYFTAAAVIAGSVLEDGLRKLCVKNGITLSTKPKLDAMNADLAKAGAYNLLKQKQITVLADLRNKAAHGQGGFTKEDVEAMIKDVRRFMADYFS